MFFAVAAGAKKPGAGTLLPYLPALRQLVATLDAAAKLPGASRKKWEKETEVIVID